MSRRSLPLAALALAPLVLAAGCSAASDEPPEAPPTAAPEGEAAAAADGQAAAAEQPADATPDAGTAERKGPVASLEVKKAVHDLRMAALTTANPVRRIADADPSGPDLIAVDLDAAVVATVDRGRDGTIDASYKLVEGELVPVE